MEIPKEASILVTGADGCIGRAFAERLQRERAEFVACGSGLGEGPWTCTLEVDPRLEALSGVSLEPIKEVFHLLDPIPGTTAQSARSLRSPEGLLEATRSLVKACQKAQVETFIHLSTVHSMGAGNPSGLVLEPMNERWPHTPQSDYGTAAIESERLVAEAGFKHAVILRPATLFGGHQMDPLHRLGEGVRSGAFPPLNLRMNRHSFIHLDDVVEYALRAASMPIAAGKTYILASRNAPSTRQLYDAFRDALGMEPLERSLPAGIVQLRALYGTVVKRIAGRSLFLRTDTLRELSDSAWYSGEKAEEELHYTAQKDVLEWITTSSLLQNPSEQPLKQALT
jgi:UDP-glucose 4-epimerase